MTFLDRRDSQGRWGGHESTMKIAKDITELIGHTPLLRLNKVTEGCVAEVVAKLESQNPVERERPHRCEHDPRGRARGKIQPGKTVLIEPTSGNTGIGLAFVAAVKGYKLILTMPETMSLERRVLLLAFGAELVLTPGPRGMKGAILKAGSCSPALRIVTCRSRSTTPPIPRFTSRPPAPKFGMTRTAASCFCSLRVGTGGTITGVCEYIKPKKASFKAIAVEPAESPVLSGGKPGPTRFRASAPVSFPEFSAPITLMRLFRLVTTRRFAWRAGSPLEEGIFVGISSGAAVAAALQVAKRPENKGKLVVVVLPSFGERYLSTVLFEELRTRAQQIPASSLPDIRGLFEAEDDGARTTCEVCARFLEEKSVEPLFPKPDCGEFAPKVLASAFPRELWVGKGEEFCAPLPRLTPGSMALLPRNRRPHRLGWFPNR